MNEFHILNCEARRVSVCPKPNVIGEVRTKVWTSGYLNRTAAVHLVLSVHLDWLPVTVPVRPQAAHSGASCDLPIVRKPGPREPPGRGWAGRSHRPSPAGLRVTAGGFPQLRVRLRATRSLRPVIDVSLRRRVSCHWRVLMTSRFGIKLNPCTV